MVHRNFWASACVLLFVSAGFCLADAGALKVTASSDRQWTGVAVSDQGRIFVNYPYWADDVPVSVAEIVDGRAVPYPSPEWNDRKNDESFNAVQSVVIDAENRLWVLDTHNPKFKGVERKGPVLFQFDLKTNRKVKAFPFPAGIYQPNSYFNDVRIDTEKEVAYLTDSGNGALIVLNLTTGRSRRLLEAHPSVHSEIDYLVCDGVIWKNSVDSDGIALTPNGSTLYYIALTGHTLYRISTDALSDEALSPEELARHVETVAAVPATDGMMFDRDGNLWLGGLENNAVNMIDSGGNLIRVLQDPAIRWADSFAMDRTGTIYFTTSQIHLPEKDRGPYQVLSFQPEQVQGKMKLYKTIPSE
jgi:sugar lactone lactonase YvrE